MMSGNRTRVVFKHTKPNQKQANVAWKHVSDLKRRPLEHNPPGHNELWGHPTWRLSMHSPELLAPGRVACHIVQLPKPPSRGTGKVNGCGFGRIIICLMCRGGFGHWDAIHLARLLFSYHSIVDDQRGITKLGRKIDKAQNVSRWAAYQPVTIDDNECNLFCLRFHMLFEGGLCFGFLLLVTWLIIGFSFPFFPPFFQILFLQRATVPDLSRPVHRLGSVRTAGSQQTVA